MSITTQNFGFEAPTATGELHVEETHPKTYVITPFQESNFYKLCRKRQATNKDWQAILTSRSAERSLGKTTLGIRLCQEFDTRGWDPDKAFLDVGDYVDYYIDESTPGEVLLQDETEIGADSRRFMSHSNVEFSQVIAACRFKQVSSVYTLPTTEMLDSRIYGLCTWWIHVVERGVAAVYYIAYNDYEGYTVDIPVRGPNGHQEFIYFDDLAGHPHKEDLDKQKDEYVTKFINNTLQTDRDQHNELKQKAKKEHESEIRDRVLEMYLSEYSDKSQREIAEMAEENYLSHFDHVTSVSQQHVSKVNQRL